jgi:predicted RNA-binding Zn-ribbon protein involved in translation (DUF1610 family)
MPLAGERAMLHAELASQSTARAGNQGAAMIVRCRRCHRLAFGYRPSAIGYRFRGLAES